MLSWFSPLKSTCTGITNIILLPIKQSSERVLKSLTSLDAAAMHQRCDPTEQFGSFYNTMQVFDQQHKAGQGFDPTHPHYMAMSKAGLITAKETFKTFQRKNTKLVKHRKV